MCRIQGYQSLEKLTFVHLLIHTWNMDLLCQNIPNPDGVYLVSFYFKNNVTNPQTSV